MRALSMGHELRNVTGPPWAPARMCKMVQLKELEFFISAPYLFKTITLAATIPSGGMIKRGISMKPLAWDLSLFSRALSCLCQQLQVHIFDITIRFIASPDIEHFLSTNLPPTLTDTSLRYSTLLVCDTPTNTQCTGCKSAYYRSTAHIAQVWIFLVYRQDFLHDGDF